MPKYQVIFQSSNSDYSKVDFETENYDQAQEVRGELQAEAYLMGERDFYYIIKRIG